VLSARVATGASPVPPKQSAAEHAQLPNACHSDKVRSAKEESAVPALTCENIFRVIISGHR
jgi:hypothetical protein